MYEERRSAIRGAFVWTARAAGHEGRILPDGCIDLLWDGHEIVIAGPDTHARLVDRPAGAVMTGLRFRPGFAPRVLGVPSDELTDQRVPLVALWPAARVREAADRVATSSAPGRALETVALRHCDGSDDERALIDAIAVLAASGCSATAIAERVGLSARQLQRRSRAAFGYGVKTLERILRMQRALDLVRSGARAADSAARAGYADQAHLAREVKALAGIPLGQLVR